jgi:hypothetical protein
MDLSELNAQTGPQKSMRETGRLSPSQINTLHERKGEEMKNSKAGFVAIVAAFALTLVLAPAAKASPKGCSNATLKGTYGDQDTGWIGGIGAFAGVNLDTFDGNGNMTSTGIASLNGTIVPGTGSGTYTVNSDCTGTYVVQSGGQTIHAYFVINDNGNELQIVITDPGTAITCIAKKQFVEDRD